MAKKNKPDGIPGIRFKLGVLCFILMLITSALGSVGCGMSSLSISNGSGCKILGLLPISYLVLIVFFTFCKLEWIAPVAIISIPIIIVISLSL